MLRLMALGLAFASLLMISLACARGPRNEVPLGPPETFTWVRQPVECAVPPPVWRREGENGSGRLGIRFILTGGVGEVIALNANYRVAEQEPRPTLADVLPAMRLVPENRQEPFRWRIGRERDTTLAGHPAFAGDDTLITPEGPLLYRQVIWVVNGCPFEATYQGLPKNAHVFDRWLATVRFPEASDAH